MNSLTDHILRVIGSPFVTSKHKIDAINYNELPFFASKNRIFLLYLESAAKLGKLGDYESRYLEVLDRCAKNEWSISKASDMLGEIGFKYAFFKSIRPYREVTVDFDILVFGSAYGEVCDSFLGSGYHLLAEGPLSTTFRDEKAGIDFDIYNEIGVSHIIYLDKGKFIPFIRDKELSIGSRVPVLASEADLLAVIGHSVIKEQMYVLSEYYTTLFYLSNMNESLLREILLLLDLCRIRPAVETHLGITAMLHHQVHGFIPEPLNKLLLRLDANDLELSRVHNLGFNMPYKYHPMTIGRALIEKLREEKARRSFASQITSMLNPVFASSFFEKMRFHIIRETY